MIVSIEVIPSPARSLLGGPGQSTPPCVYREGPGFWGGTVPHPTLASFFASLLQGNLFKKDVRSPTAEKHGQISATRL